MWWYPDSALGEAEEIDVGEGLGDVQITPQGLHTASRGANGSASGIRTAAWSGVRVHIDRTTDGTLARNLYAIENHLHRGGMVAVCHDADKAVAGFLSLLPDRGVTSVSLVDRPWPHNSSAALVANDEVVLQGPSPEYRRELDQVSAVSGDTYTLNDGTRYNYTADGWVLFRYRYFFPMLRLPPDRRNQGPLLTYDGLVSYTFDAQLEEAVDAFETFASTGSVIGTDGTYGSGGPDLLILEDRSKSASDQPTVTFTGGT